MPTLKAYRRGFMDTPPFVGEVHTTGVLEGSVYVGVPNTADSKRIVASETLADNGRASSDTASDFYQGGYIYIGADGTQRRIADSGYVDHADAEDILDDGSPTEVGYFFVNRDYAAEIDPGTEFEVHPLLPPAVNADRLPSIHSLINRALRSMRWTRRISFTGNAGDRYSLSGYPEVILGSQVAAMYMGEVGAYTEPTPLYGGATLRWDGANAYLITGQRQSSGQSFTADIYTPASAWIKSNGTWQASTVGLVDEDDEAMLPVDQVVKVALYFAFDALSRYAPSESDRAAWQTERDRAAVIARQFMHFQQPEANPQIRAVSRTVSMTGRRSWP